MEPTAVLSDRLEPELFRALGDPRRCDIVCDLAGCCGESRSVGELAEGLPVDLSVVSRHLKALRASGVIDVSREGRSVRYSLRADELAAQLRQLADALEACSRDGGACCCDSDTARKEGR